MRMLGAKKTSLPHYVVPPRSRTKPVLPGYQVTVANSLSSRSEETPLLAHGRSVLPRLSLSTLNSSAAVYRQV